MARVKTTRIRSSLRYSFWDGFFASIQFAIIEQFIIPLALFLGASNMAIGFLSFVRNAFISIVQIFSADLSLLFKSRKKLITFSVLMAALFLPLTYFVPFLFGRYRVLVFILLFTLASSFNVLATPAWASLMSEYIPFRKRGSYFGFRGTALGLVYCVSLVAGGLILHYLHNVSLFLAFGILMGVAFVSRIVSWFFLTRHYEPRWRVGVTDYFSFGDFLKRFWVSNFARFSVFAAAFLFGTAIVSPFFAVYLLNDLKFDYLSYTFLMGAAVFTTFVTQRYWGIFTDQYGNNKIIKLTALLISLIPFLWLFSGDFGYLFMVQLFAGFIWAGYNLSSSNFIYDAAVSTKRERCIAYYNFLSGVGFGVGALLGGIFYKFPPLFMGSVFYFLLVISGLVRLVFAVSISLFTKEVRSVYPIHPRVLLFDIFGMRLLGLLSRELLFREKRAGLSRFASLIGIVLIQVCF